MTRSEQIIVSAGNNVSLRTSAFDSTKQAKLGNSIEDNVPGNQIFLNANGSVFGAFQGLYAALQSNSNMPAVVTQIQDALSQVSTQRVFYGNSLNQITLRETFLNQGKVNLSTQENSLIGADPATASSDLSQAQTAYQCDLASTARILNLPSPLNFLH
jgi:flagellin-like hook-associated protein FlgL